MSIIDAPKLRIAQAARRLGLHVSTLYRWASRGIDGRILPTIKVGGHCYVLVDDLEAFLDAGREHAEQSVVPTRADRRDEDAGTHLERVGT